MAKDAQQDTQDTTEPTEKVERKPSKFIIAVRRKGETQWTHLDSVVEAITQEDAKKKAARALLETPEYGATIQAEGLELAAVSARGFKPIVVKVEPQPAKLVLA